MSVVVELRGGWLIFHTARINDPLLFKSVYPADAPGVGDGGR